MTNIKTVNYKEIINSDKINQFLDTVIRQSCISEDIIDLLEELNMELKDKNGKQLQINIPVNDIKEYLTQKALTDKGV